MNKAPSRQEIEEKAKENPVNIPERLELYRGEFIKFFDEETFKQIVETFNSFDGEDKKRFYLDFLMAKNNTEYYQEQKQENNLYNCSICNNTLNTHGLEFYNDGTGHYFHHENKPCKCNLIRKSLIWTCSPGLCRPQQFAPRQWDAAYTVLRCGALHCDGRHSQSQRPCEPLPSPAHWHIASGPMPSAPPNPSR